MSSFPVTLRAAPLVGALVVALLVVVLISTTVGVAGAQPLPVPAPPVETIETIETIETVETVPGPQAKKLPQVRGQVRWPRTLRAFPGRWDAPRDRTRYRWFRDGEPIKGAGRRRYQVQPDDVGSRLSVQVRVRSRGLGWGVAESKRTGPVKHRIAVRRVVTYHVETRGDVTGVGTFATLAQQTFDEPRGWRSSGVEFRRVARGGQFTLVLAEASWLPRFSSACSATWSCRVGRHVVINQVRWQHASPAWNAAGRSLRDYRHMVVNHETGHWLGRGHRGCPGQGKPAPVMMQQSKGTSGCRFNPWPTGSEL